MGVIMSKEQLCITDNTTRILTPDIDRQLKQLAQQKLQQAEQREKELLNKSTIMDVFIDLILKIKSGIHNKQKTK